MTSFIFSAIRKAIARVVSVSLLDISNNIEPSALRLRAITSSACEAPKLRCRQILPSTAASSIPSILPIPSTTAPAAAAIPSHFQTQGSPAPASYSTSYSLRAARRIPCAASERCQPSISKSSCRLVMRTIVVGSSENPRVFRGVDMGMVVVRVATTGLAFRRPMLKHVVRGMSHHRFIPNQFDRRKAPAKLLFPDSSSSSAAPAQPNDTRSAFKSALKTAVFGSNENRRFLKVIDLGLATARVATATMSIRNPAMKHATRALLHLRFLPNNLDPRRAIVQHFLQERK